MPRSPFASTFGGDGTRTNAPFPSVAPVAPMFSGWQPDAHQGFTDIGDFYFGLQPGDPYGGQMFGGQQVEGFHSVNPADPGLVNDFDLAGDFDLTPVRSNSSSSFTDNIDPTLVDNSSPSFTGDISAAGFVGVISSTGFAGDISSTGFAGDISSTGFAGDNSSSGFTGDNSSSGFTGDNSSSGFTGDDIDGEHDSDVDDDYTPPEQDPSSDEDYIGNIGSLAPGSTHSHPKKATKGSNKNTSQDAVMSTEAMTTITKKTKQANFVIAAQKKERNEQKRIGANVTLTTTGVCSTQGVFWEAPKNDNTIPRSQEDKTSLVAVIVEAFKNNHGCKEKDNTKQFRNRWGDSATHYSDHDFRAVAWEVLNIMVDVHENGWTKAIYDKNQRELIQKTMFFSFGDRFDCVIDLLRHSKRSCLDLMKGERQYSIIGNPYVLENRTSSNERSNKTKAGRIAKATQLERLHKTAVPATPAQKKSKVKTPAEPTAKGKGKKRAREEDEETEAPVAPPRAVKKARKARAD